MAIGREPMMLMTLMAWLYSTQSVGFGSNLPRFGLQFPLATWVASHWLADRFDRVGEKILPDVFVQVVAIGIPHGSFSRGDATVGPFFIATDLRFGDEPSGVAVGRLLLVDVDDRTIGLQS